LRLQKNTLLAIQSVLEFAAQPARQLSVAEIAASLKASPHHLAKVLRALGRAGLVESMRGARGGYRFVANAKRVTLMDVIGVFEDIGARAAPAPRAPPRRAGAGTGARGDRPDGARHLRLGDARHHAEAPLPP
jgi:Rrf2 family protein